MKKIILGVAVAGLVASCQKVQPGGNLGVLQMEEGAQKYTDDVMSDEATAKVSAMQANKSTPAMDSGAVSMKPEVMVKADSTVDATTKPSVSAPAN